MKLRVRGNSIRLRLTQSEVGRILAGETVAERCEFVGASLGYSLGAADAAPGARLEGSAIDVRLPQSQLSAWGDSPTQVGIEVSDGPLSVLIEKDFACLDPRPGAEDADTFPNPKAS
ncbi:MAG: hypothetical protein AAF515_10590 [Pseudomonadota bacterium]